MSLVLRDRIRTVCRVLCVLAGLYLVVAIVAYQFARGSPQYATIERGLSVAYPVALITLFVLTVDTRLRRRPR